ncbi:MASE1 domain-containing protein [Streptomyces sp. NBC_00335]|uniref:MASE1 domain-containing protein n=1 Tax=unclassified Streptomyces TaxID=2593676 RepID=UPI0022562500|nr:MULTISPECIES: MASE1 domain-containing protein [unclassified Streptomyces]MCX5403564.1 MASE1 domain-containing protein [Streptomyces sp. NBC_00086]
MVRTVEWRRPAEALLRILGVAVAYYATGRLGLLLHVSVEGAVVTPLWLPTGIAVACLLWCGPRIWPGIALGTYLAIERISAFDPVDLGIVAGNTLAPLCAYALLRRAGFRPELDRLRDGLALVFLGGLLPMLISSTTGTWTLVLTGDLPLPSFWPVWSAWWAGDTMGVLLVTPLLLVLRRARLPRDPYRVAEAAALAVTVSAVTLTATRSSLSLLFLVFPLLIWAAVRFRLPGSAPCALLVSVLAITAATDRAGPFAGHTLFEIMVNLQALNGAAALTALLLAALVTEQDNVRLKIEELCEDLADVVARLAPPKE